MYKVPLLLNAVHRCNFNEIKVKNKIYYISGHLVGLDSKVRLYVTIKELLERFDVYVQGVASNNNRIYRHPTDTKSTTQSDLFKRLRAVNKILKSNKQKHPNYYNSNCTQKDNDAHSMASMYISTFY